MNSSIVVLAVIVMMIVIANAYDERKVAPQASICMENMESCSGQYKCCKGFTCQNTGGRRRCVRSGGNGNCIRRGERCNRNGNRRCCNGRCRQGINGRSTCR